jgi:hypothetical protein
MAQSDLYDRLEHCVNEQEYNQILNELQRIDIELIDRPTGQQYNQILNEIADLNNDISDCISQAQFDEFIAVTNAVNDIQSAEIANRVDLDFFGEWSTTIENELDARVTRQYFDQFAINVFNKAEVIKYIDDLLLFKNYATADWVEEQINTATEGLDLTDYYNKSQINVLLDNLILGDGNIELNNYYTKEQIDELLTNVDIDLSRYYTKEQIHNLLNDIGSNLDLSNYYKKSEIDKKLDELVMGEIDVDLNNYYNKQEINDIIGNIDAILNNVLYEY